MNPLEPDLRAIVEARQELAFEAARPHGHASPTVARTTTPIMTSRSVVTTVAAASSRKRVMRGSVILGMG